MAGVTLLDLDCDCLVGPSGGAAILPGCKNDANSGIGGNGDCVTGGAEGSCVAGGTVTGANGGGTADGAGGGPTVMPPVVPVELVAMMPV